ncbi:pilus assembly PilX N-terminal domain-containing protein [Desulfoprunum benzoelyticum]|uniref:Type 4 fimbrial biogenesis protein PilX N-terminal domain-containing protein n=1 Tax=Desulfoprunum benzoelyticum TaxID=1506996 RepID=A0A840UK91_9BACT|nr:pilus assembly PilX N-terminal domain-containing protein [Desulfoprunum benzoelyticum]MBB5346757.1 hypothetical protein [Desulfoprunum benzoelyticum]MBM9531548.1 pilus assembly PilX N-terminal domain-containing protein [Desulfoprunum benzoelyticum]
MQQLRNISQKEDGYVLVVALLVMAILSLLGIAGMNTSTFEMQVAGNDWNAKRTFYKADGGISRGIELLELNIACAPGFSGDIVEDIHVKSKSLYFNSPFDPYPATSPEIPGESDSVTTGISLFDEPKVKYDAAYPHNIDDFPPDYDVGYLYFGGETKMLEGGALQMAAGYEGKGKSAAQGGVAKIYDIYSQFLGPKNSESIIVVNWRHMIGSEGTCGEY